MKNKFLFAILLLIHWPLYGEANTKKEHNLPRNIDDETAQFMSKLAKKVIKLMMSGASSSSSNESYLHTLERKKEFCDLAIGCNPPSKIFKYLKEYVSCVERKIIIIKYKINKKEIIDKQFIDSAQLELEEIDKKYPDIVGVLKGKMEYFIEKEIKQLSK